jgi:hypothetical protein
MRSTTFNSVAGLNQALRKLPKQETIKLRDAAQGIANDVVPIAQARARGVANRGYGIYVAPTIKAARDRVPVIKMGGTKRIRKGSSRQTVGDLIWGMEFGGRARDRTMQFLPHLGQTGYALWPTIRDLSPDIGDRYSEALADALESI